jgi:hypothetical protein
LEFSLLSTGRRKERERHVGYGNYSSILGLLTYHKGPIEVIPALRIKYFSHVLNRVPNESTTFSWKFLSRT